MKQSFLLLAFLILFDVAHSQITIQSSDVISIGFVAKQSTDTLPDASIVEGGVGNINWDFTALKQGTDGQYVFFEPTTTPYSASFPNANLASRVEPELYAYMVKDNDKIEIIGVEGTIAISSYSIQGKLDVVPGQSLIRFPATFGNAYDETIKQQGQVTGAEIGLNSFDSVRVVNTVVRSIDIDAWGNMEIPSGVFNTLRSSETETTTQQVYILTAGNWSPLGPPSTSTKINYNWWTIDNDGLAFPVVQMVYNPTSNSRTVTFLLTLTDVKNLFDKEATIFPNPASEYLNIGFDNPFSGYIEIYDVNGKRTVSKKVSESFAEKIELTTCVAGMHIAILKHKNGELAGYKKFQVFK